MLIINCEIYQLIFHFIYFTFQTAYLSDHNTIIWLFVNAKSPEYVSGLFAL